MKKKNIDSEIQTQSELLMTRIIEFFKNENHLKKMIDILSGYSQLSLRIIDWFVTNYSKKYDVIYALKKEDYNEIYDLNFELIDDIQHTKFIVFLEYKSQLKAYSKKQFDSFCRGERIKFNYMYQNEKYEIETTVGQLNFFRWAIQNNLFIYIVSHYDKIEKDMNESIYNKKIKKKEGSNNKRMMYQPQNNAFQKKNFKVLVYFN
jgi:hypothetical protein